MKTIPAIITLFICLYYHVSGVVAQQVADTSELECSKLFMPDLQLQDLILRTDKSIVQTFITQPGCVQKLAGNNFLLSITAAMDVVEKDLSLMEIEQLLDQYQNGATAYTSMVGRFMDRAKEINTYQVVQPTVSWAQDLNKIYIEVKLAHRFDAPGCANHTEVSIDIKDNKIGLNALCNSISSRIKYVLDLALWGKIQSSEPQSAAQYQAVGKYHLKLSKAEKGRWPQLYPDEFPKPYNTRLHLEWHEKYVNELVRWDNDPYDEFPGHDLNQEEEDEEREQQRYRDIPKKGPIPLKKKGKKKKKDNVIYRDHKL